MCVFSCTDDLCHVRNRRNIESDPQLYTSDALSPQPASPAMASSPTTARPSPLIPNSVSWLRSDSTHRSVASPGRRHFDRSVDQTRTSSPDIISWHGAVQENTVVRGYDREIGVVVERARTPSRQTPTFSLVRVCMFACRIVYPPILVCMLNLFSCMQDDWRHAHLMHKVTRSATPPRATAQPQNDANAP